MASGNLAQSKPIIVCFSILHRETVSHIQSTIGEKLFESCLRGKVPDGKELLTQNELVQLKRCIYSTSVSLLNMYEYERFQM